jgi:hypothetical protein
MTCARKQKPRSPRHPHTYLGTLTARDQRQRRGGVIDADQKNRVRTVEIGIA